MSQQSLPKNTLWQFTDTQGSFRVTNPEAVSRLYFPLANEAGILSSITPDLHGDIKTSHNSFLTLPVTIEDLHDSKSSRNFWLHVEGKGAWSATGVSSLQSASRAPHRQSPSWPRTKDKTSLRAGALWHEVTRENEDFGLRAEIVNFAPVGPDTVELMVVTVTNIGRTQLRLTPTSAVPIFGRSADNLRDHHHVTTLLHRVVPHASGVIVRPTMSFDERGHRINEMLYAVVGADGAGETPVGVFSTVPDFIGEGGHLEAPRAVLENLPPPQKDGHAYHGKPAIGALRFRTVGLAPQQKVTYVLALGIARKESEIGEWVRKYGSAARAAEALRQVKAYWSARLDSTHFKTQSPALDGWLRWVTLQPTLRKLFGCSFLPDFDYGRGGRGWRDLWQDCLALLLTSPAEAQDLLLNNFHGVRIDGSNATIIGSAPGEFVADRNNITRVWMDHGVWPFLTLELYLHQTGDFDILFRKTRYFRDTQQSRSQLKDPSWTEEYGKNLKDRRGRVVESSVLEHVLVQHLVQFYNVGEHNHIRLENADWNDGLDMAHARGESVAFTCLYAWNLRRLAELVETLRDRAGLKKIELLAEIGLLLDRVGGRKVDYASVPAKRKRLETYFGAVQPEVSGRRIQVPCAALAADLRAKADFITEHVRKREWIETRSGEGYFNGYYDNHGRRVEGDFPQGIRMTLAGQVFPVMSRVADNRQVEEIFRTARKHLKDPEHGGFRLNTNFHEIRPDLGRAFSFAYGEKENGAFFSHMAVMFANALYQRGFVNEGSEVIHSIFRMCLRTDKSRIYPGIPEYFNSEGRGLYHYLTGSASWFVMTYLTQIFGVRGHYGDLVLAPKFTKDVFDEAIQVSVLTHFAGKRVEVVYRNPQRLGYERYHVTKLQLNGRELKEIELGKKEALIGRAFFLKHARKNLNTLVVTLL